MTEQPAVQGRCPICGKPRDQNFRPFCSRRCRDRDFLAWADGRYAIPAAQDPGDDDDAASDGSVKPDDGGRDTD